MVLLVQVSICNSLNAQAPLDKGDYVPNFIEIDEKGNQINLESYKGKVVLLNFTATWCGPCWETYAPMDELQKQYPDNLVIISFHMDKMKKKWKKKAASKGITFDVISVWESKSKREIMDSFAPELFPSFVLLNQEGKIIKKWEGNYEKYIRQNVKKAMRRVK